MIGAFSRLQNLSSNRPNLLGTKSSRVCSKKSWFYSDIVIKEQNELAGRTGQGHVQRTGL
jgi:hypothetical protein